MARSLLSAAAWARAMTAIRSGEPLLLALDLDGTLAPIVRRPERVRVAPRTRRLIQRAALARGIRVAVVSARPRSVLRRLLPARGVLAIAQYGIEGPLVPASLDRRAARRACARIARALDRAAEGVPGARVERKGLTVALHDRGVAARRLGPLRRAVARIARGEARRLGFHLVPGRRASDFVPAGFDKGSALRALIAAFRPATTFYFGDSPGDEAAFRALRRGGFPVRVGPGPTRAAYRVGDLRGVTRVLAAVIRLRSG